MLYFNFEKLFKLRGISRGTTFLRKHGMTPYQARSVVYNNGSRSFFRNLEKVCLALDCTPNDLIEWKPSRAEDDAAGIALQKIRASEGIDLHEAIKGVPMDRLGEVKQAIVDAVEKIKNSDVK